MVLLAPSPNLSTHEFRPGLSMLRRIISLDHITVSLMIIQRSYPRTGCLNFEQEQMIGLLANADPKNTSSSVIVSRERKPLQRQVMIDARSSTSSNILIRHDQVPVQFRIRIYTQQLEAPTTGSPAPLPLLPSAAETKTSIATITNQYRDVIPPASGNGPEHWPRWSTHPLYFWPIRWPDCPRTAE
jgi:hypothetical protein